MKKLQNCGKVTEVWIGDNILLHTTKKYVQILSSKSFIYAWFILTKSYHSHSLRCSSKLEKAILLWIRILSNVWLTCLVYSYYVTHLAVFPIFNIPFLCKRFRGRFTSFSRVQTVRCHSLGNHKNFFRCRCFGYCFLWI